MRAALGVAVAVVSAAAAVVLLGPADRPAELDATDADRTWTITLTADGHSLTGGWGPDGTHWKVATPRSMLQTRHRDGDVWVRWQDDGWVRVDGHLPDRTGPLRRLADDLLSGGPTTVDVGQLYQQAGPPVRPDRGGWTLPAGQVTLTAEPSGDLTWQASLPAEVGRVLFSDQAGAGTVTVATGRLPDPDENAPTVAAADLPEHVTGGAGSTVRTTHQVAADVTAAQAEHAMQAGSFTADVGDLEVPRDADVSVRLCTTSDGGRWSGWVDVFGENPTFLSDEQGVVDDGGDLPCQPLQGRGSSREPAATAPSRSSP